MNKKIDVIIPVYNEEKFSIMAIESAVNQTLKPNKIIVVNDGSTDNSREIIENYAKKINVQLEIIDKQNGGISSARNAGIKKSESEFVAFLDADDLWEPQKLEEQLNKFNNSQFDNLGLVYTRYQHIDSDGKKNRHRLVRLDKRFKGMAFKYIISANKILGSASSVLIKKKVFDEIGLFDENLKFAEDWDMWIRISQKYSIDFVDNVLVNIRKHNKNRTSNYTKTFDGELEFYNKWGKIIKNEEIPIQWRDRIIGQLIRNLTDKKMHSIINNVLDKNIYKKMFPHGISYCLMIRLIVKKILIKIIDING